MGKLSDKAYECLCKDVISIARRAKSAEKNRCFGMVSALKDKMANRFVYAAEHGISTEQLWSDVRSMMA